MTVCLSVYLSVNLSIVQFGNFLVADYYFYSAFLCEIFVKSKHWESQIFWENSLLLKNRKVGLKRPKIKVFYLRVALFFWTGCWIIIHTINVVATQILGKFCFLGYEPKSKCSRWTRFHDFEISNIWRVTESISDIFCMVI